MIIFLRFTGGIKKQKKTRNEKRGDRYEWKLGDGRGMAHCEASLIAPKTAGKTVPQLHSIFWCFHLRFSRVAQQLGLSQIPHLPHLHLLTVPQKHEPDSSIISKPTRLLLGLKPY
jgi:hypothetical protein